MKKLIFTVLIFLVLLAFTTVAFANPYDFKVKRVIDGDTVVIETPFLPKELGDHMSIRVFGVDTPEKAFRAKCELENTKGVAATLFTDNEVHSAKEIKIVIKGWDKYGDRILGDIILDGIPLSTKLIQKGYAVPYNGKGKKKDWCNE